MPNVSSSPQPDPRLQARFDQLAEKANFGRLSEVERDEYRDIVEAIDVVAIIKAKARAIWRLLNSWNWPRRRAVRRRANRLTLASTRIIHQPVAARPQHEERANDNERLSNVRDHYVSHVLEKPGAQFADENPHRTAIKQRTSGLPDDKPAQIAAKPTMLGSISSVTT